jgi:uncharacterized tellurite resistance protein B-like protein
MRSYPRNSPEAAARILSLAALADGSLSTVEIETLDRQDAYAQLGLHRVQLQDVMRGLCVDLLSSARPSDTSVCRVAPQTMATILAEIDDPALRLTLLQLCVAVIEADQFVDPGEALVLLTVLEQWGLENALHTPAPGAQQAAAPELLH